MTIEFQLRHMAATLVLGTSMLLSTGCANMPQGVAQDATIVGLADSGALVRLAPEQELVVRLNANRASGFQWRIDKSIDQTVLLADGSKISLTSQQRSRGDEVGTQMLRFIAHASADCRAVSAAAGGAKEEASKLEDAVLNTTCVLEAFGNARTKHNHNSSRFGKLTCLGVTPHGSDIAAHEQPQRRDVGCVVGAQYVPLPVGLAAAGGGGGGRRRGPARGGTRIGHRLREDTRPWRFHGSVTQACT